MSELPPADSVERLHDRDDDGVIAVSDITADQFWQAIRIVNAVSRERPADHLLETSNLLNDLMGQAQ